MNASKPLRVIVGMSGGSDSSLAAALLKKQGHEVIGLTFRLYDYQASVEETSLDKQHCHPDQFIRQAADVANHLGIAHYVRDQQSFFKETIIEPFLQGYRQGSTPLPCVRCNRDVKTSLMIQAMEEFQADAVATGHYVRSVTIDNAVQIHQGQDPVRDQSFFLFGIPYQDLRRTLFPLGGYSKEQTRQEAEKFGLPNARVAASQDLCFISTGSYKSLFPPRQGDIVHQDGRWLGHHQGIERYTLGQRQGIGVGGQKEPLYVLRLDPEKNQVIVGPYSALARHFIPLVEVNWLAPDTKDWGGAWENDVQGLTFLHQGSLAEKEQSYQEQWDHWSERVPPHCVFKMQVKMRSSGRPVSANIIIFPQKSQALVKLEKPEHALSPGQVCVFYQGTRLMGGGWMAPSL